MMEDRIITLAQLNAGEAGMPLGSEMWMYEGPLTHRDTDFLPVRFDALIGIAVHHGSAVFSIDGKEYRLEPNTVGILRPYCYLSNFSTLNGEPIDVSIIGCSEKVEDNMADTLSEIMPLVIKLHIDPVVKMQPGGVEELRPYLDLLRRMAVNEPRQAQTSRKAGCIFKAAIYEIIERRMPDETSGLSGRSREITAHFFYLLGKYFQEHRDVEFYATSLQISAKHLSTVLKATSGKTAGDWIELYVVREAKILLSNSSLRIKEIASRLHFSSQAFFGKYFRNITGMSPSDYRR